MKTEKNVFVRLLTAVCVSAFLGGAFTAPAQAAFPQDQAGIAAYVKLEGVNLESFENAKKNLFELPESVGGTFMIGSNHYAINDSPYSAGGDKISVKIYLGVDGWLAAYLLKDESLGKIINWKTGATIADNILKVAVEDAMQKITHTGAGTIKYYDFANPQASKMTIIVENIGVDDEGYTDEFSVLIPGDLKRASYSLLSSGCNIASHYSLMILYLNGSYVAGQPSAAFLWGDYDLTKFIVGGGNKILTSRMYGSQCKTDSATVLVYNPY